MTGNFAIVPAGLPRSAEVAEAGRLLAEGGLAHPDLAAATALGLVALLDLDAIACGCGGVSEPLLRHALGIGPESAGKILGVLRDAGLIGGAGAVAGFSDRYGALLRRRALEAERKRRARAGTAAPKAAHQPSPEAPAPQAAPAAPAEPRPRRRAERGPLDPEAVAAGAAMNAAPTNPHNLLPIRVVAARLGLCDETVRRMVRRGRLPHLRTSPGRGGKILISVEALTPPATSRAAASESAR